jgi:tetratricopeptide (TPR) repeat protein
MVGLLAMNQRTNKPGKFSGAPFTPLWDWAGTNEKISDLDLPVIAKKLGDHLETKQDDVEALESYLEILCRMGDFSQAKSVSKKLLKICPLSIPALKNLSLLYILGNDLKPAVEVQKSLILANPNSTEVYLSLALTYSKLGNHAAAIKTLEYIEPANSGYALKLLAFEYFAVGRSNEAAKAAKKCINIVGTDADLLNLLGQISRQNGDFDGALSYLERALDSDPSNHNLVLNFSDALVDLRRYAEAKELLTSRSYDLAENTESAILMRLGMVEHYLNPSSENSLNFFNRSLEADTANATAHYNKGLVCLDLGLYQAALEEFRGARIKGLASFENDYSEALANLHLSQFSLAWKLYDARLAVKKMVPPQLSATIPAASIETRQKQLVIWGEQGLGEQLLFARYLGIALNEFSRVDLITDSRLIPIFKTIHPAANFHARTDSQAVPLDKSVAQTPLLSLPHILNLHSYEQLTLPKRSWMLNLKGRKHSHVKPLESSGRLVCGLSWRSGNQDFGDKKSIDLDLILNSMPLAKCFFIYLQFDSTLTEIEDAVEKYNVDIFQDQSFDRKNDLLKLCELISCCDIVVTVSNTVAHLAGLLGADVLLLLPKGRGHLWYWTGINMSLFYPTITAINQIAVGDWSTPLKKCGALIEQHASRRSQQP